MCKGVDQRGESGCTTITGCSTQRRPWRVSHWFKYRLWRGLIPRSGCEQHCLTCAHCIGYGWHGSSQSFRRQVPFCARFVELVARLHQTYTGLKGLCCCQVGESGTLAAGVCQLFAVGTGVR